MVHIFYFQRKILLSCIIIFTYGLSFGQSGDYLITHTKPEFPKIDHFNFDIIQDRNGLICIANRSGILRYDGTNWDLIPTPGAVLSLVIDEENNLFAGCLNEFGKVDFQGKKYEYTSLSGEIDTHNDLFDQTVCHNGMIYFASEKKIVKYNPENGETLILHELNDESLYLNHLFELNGSLYLNVSDGAIYPLNDDGIGKSGTFMPDSSILVFVEKNKNTGMYLGATVDGNLFTYNGDSAKYLPQSELIPGNQDFIAGAWINDELFGVGTLNNGCYVLNINDPEFSKTINFNNGLPDNEVLAISSDANHGLWIAHEFGLSRVVPELPIKSFSNYPGLEGNLISVSHIKGKLYVTTSTGTYYFDQEKEYRNTVYYVARRKTTTSTLTSTPSQTQTRQDKPASKEQPVATKKKKERKSFLGFGRKKKQKDPPEPVAPLEEEVRKDPTKPGLMKRIFGRKEDDRSEERGVQTIKRKPDQGVEYVRRTRKELISSRYVYKSISGLETKCKQILEYRNKLLVVGPSGVYEINGDSAIQVIDEPVQYGYVTPDDQHLILSCYDRSIKMYEYTSELWFELDEVQFDELILTMYEDLEDRLWLGSPNLIYLAHRTDTSVVIEKEFPYTNNYFYTPLITRLDQKPYFINNQGYFYYDGGNIKRDMDIVNTIGLPENYLKTCDGDVWIFNGKIWYLLEDINAPIAFEYLSLFPNLSYIHYVPAQDKFWLISGDKHLYVFDPEVEDDEDYIFNQLIFKTVRTNSGVIKSAAKIELRYNENSLTFEIVQPDYLGLLNVEYQYIMIGLMDDWSDWIKANFINFNYLQPGTYTLQIRSRDTFGRIQEIEAMEFTISPPYWQTPWFYAIEFVLFFGLVLLSIRLNKRNVKYRFITAGLSILTLIMIIEFIQATTQGYLGIQSTPIVDFGINVGIAVFVFPLEQLLRKYMMGSTLSK